VPFPAFSPSPTPNRTLTLSHHQKTPVSDEPQTPTRQVSSIQNSPFPNLSVKRKLQLSEFGDEKGIPDTMKIKVFFSYFFSSPFFII